MLLFTDSRPAFPSHGEPIYPSNQNGGDQVPLSRELRNEVAHIYATGGPGVQALIDQFRMAVNPLIDNFILGTAPQTLSQLRAKVLQLFLNSIQERSEFRCTVPKGTRDFCHVKKALETIGWLRMTHSDRVIIVRSLVRECRFDEAIVLANSSPFDAKWRGIREIVKGLISLDRFEEAIALANSLTEEDARLSLLEDIVDGFVAKNRFGEALACAQSMPEELNKWRSLVCIAEGYAATNLFKEAIQVAQMITDRMRKDACFERIIEFLVSIGHFRTAVETVNLMPDGIFKTIALQDITKGLILRKRFDKVFLLAKLICGAYDRKNDFMARVLYNLVKDLVAHRAFSEAKKIANLIPARKFSDMPNKSTILARIANEESRAKR